MFLGVYEGAQKKRDWNRFMRCVIYFLKQYYDRLFPHTHIGYVCLSPSKVVERGCSLHCRTNGWSLHRYLYSFHSQCERALNLRNCQIQLIDSFIIGKLSTRSTLHVQVCVAPTLVQFSLISDFVLIKLVQSFPVSVLHIVSPV